MSPLSERLRTVLAGAAILAGLGVALAQVVRPGSAPAPPPGDAAAVVNGVAIGRARYDEMLARTRNARTALARVVDEELLVQRALELELPRQHNIVRGALLEAMTQIVVAENIGAEPTEERLRAFHAADPTRFAAPPKLRVERMLFSGRLVDEEVDQAVDQEVDPEEARLRSIRAHEALLQGESFASVRTRYADADLIPMPAESLEPRALSQHLGPTLVRVALTLAEAEISAPVNVGRNWYLLRVITRADGAPRSFEKTREEVAAAYRQARDRASLVAYLEWLRGRAAIVYPAGVPAG